MPRIFPEGLCLFGRGGLTFLLTCFVVGTK